MKYSKYVVISAIIGSTLLSIIVLVLNQIVFGEQSTIQFVISTAWVALVAFGLYKVFSSSLVTQDSTRHDVRRGLIGALSLLFEVVSLILLVFVAIVASNTLTVNSFSSDQIIRALTI